MDARARSLTPGLHPRARDHARPSAGRRRAARSAARAAGATFVPRGATFVASGARVIRREVTNVPLGGTFVALGRAVALCRSCGGRVEGLSTPARLTLRGP